MAGRAFGVAPIPSAHLRHREATGVAIGRALVRDEGRRDARALPELPRDERPGADPLFEGGTNTWPSAANSPNGGRSPRLNARSVGRPMCANTRRLTPARLATLATVCTSRCPPTPPTNRIGRAHPAPSANMRSASRAHGGNAENSGAQTHRTVASPDPVTVGRMIGVDHWPALDRQAISPEASGMRDEALLGGQSPDGGDELRALVSYEPRVESPGRDSPPARHRSSPGLPHGSREGPPGRKRRGLRADTQRHEPHG